MALTLAYNITRSGRGTDIVVIRSLQNGL
jgi:hypothetical protein